MAAFVYLVDFGYRPGIPEGPTVRFSSETADVVVYFNAEWHGDLDVAFRPVADKETRWPAYALSEFLALEGRPMPDVDDIATEDQLQAAVVQVARAFHDAASPTLHGDNNQQLRALDARRGESGQQREGFGQLRRPD